VAPPGANMGFSYDFAEYHTRALSVVPIESRSVGHRLPMQPKRAKRNGGALQQGPGFAHISLPFCSAFEVLFVGGNNHLARKVYLMPGQVLNMDDKRSRRSVITQHCATSDWSLAARRGHAKARSASGRGVYRCWKRVRVRPVRDDDVAYANPISLRLLASFDVAASKFVVINRASTGEPNASLVQASTRSSGSIFATVL